MEVLQEQNIKTFSLLGLKAICSHNRDILFSYNYKTRQEITNMMMMNMSMLIQKFQNIVKKQRSFCINNFCRNRKKTKHFMKTK